MKNIEKTPQKAYFRMLKMFALRKTDPQNRETPSMTSRTKRSEIPFEQFQCRVFHQWSGSWLLLAAGDFRTGDYNLMTVGWGSFGVMWSKPFAMIVVRPQRHTADFLERYSDFTLCGFGGEWKNALQFCGSRSGREIPDKAAAAGLTPVPAGHVAAPVFEEAELAVECRKTFRTEMLPGAFIPPGKAQELYPAGDFHRIYFGEILSVSAVPSFRTNVSSGAE